MDFMMYSASVWGSTVVGAYSLKDVATYCFDKMDKVKFSTSSHCAEMGLSDRSTGTSAKFNGDCRNPVLHHDCPTTVYEHSTTSMRQSIHWRA